MTHDDGMLRIQQVMRDARLADCQSGQVRAAFLAALRDVALQTGDDALASAAAICLLDIPGVYAEDTDIVWKDAY